jgi:hypothetical protein
VKIYHKKKNPLFLRKTKLYIMIPLEREKNMVLKTAHHTTFT